jgi:hypothetical protein
MALITDPNITAQIRDLANTGTIDSNLLVTLLNSVLPAGQQIATNAGFTTGIYKRFGDFDKVNAKVEVVTTGLWSGDSGSLNEFYTSSAQTTGTSGYYYTNIFDYNPVSYADSAELQFAIAYGHVDGSGSMNLADNDNALLATKATYAQYRSMLLDPTDTKFSFENSSGISTDANGIYVINIARGRFREKMDAGNWSLKLQGSNGKFTFIDNSGKKFGDDLGLSGRTFKVVSGSLNLGTESEATIKNTADTATDLAVGKPATGEGYGLFYPDRGIIVLNSKAIGSVVGSIDAFRVYTKDGTYLLSGSLSGSITQDREQFNQFRLLKAIQAGGDFEARRTENISTQHFFVRATNREFNYSNNPTYIDADGFFIESTFETDPQTFITTIGLYNDANELIAVAKTSQPIVKSFDKEVLIKVKLSF